MGNEASVPVPGAKFQVIGAGLSRTGTTSFGRALEILLDGPVHHGGTQALLGPEEIVKSWIKLYKHWPPRNPEDKALVNSILRQRYDGFVACTDVPGALLFPELLELYPDAKVIVTTRDPESWVKSMDTIGKATTMWFLRFVLFPLPGLRYFTEFIGVLQYAWTTCLGHEEQPTAAAYHNHVDWLKKTVPPERLVFFSVKEGWGPLCKALGKPIPNEPFPHINDAEAVDKFAKTHITRGLVRWAWILVATITVPAAAYYLRK